ncbi:MAG: energy-coupled thiamine transporter ThiT [Candidatus Bathyarchaeota archaeon]|nr:energy-coupled thiamine transporter ThiT [Candidatus Bathyarchaeota archaeon]
MTNQTKILAESIVCVALSALLYYFVIFSMPQGGRVTAGSMIPIFWLALRRGAKVGILAGIVFGLIVLMMEPFVFHPVQVLLDYPIAFGLLGLAGFFRQIPLLGVAVGMFGRFIAHFITGIIFFASFVPEGMSPALYSAIYNGSYLLVEFIVSIIIIQILVRRKFIDIYR